jgi:hypothetical protein
MPGKFGLRPARPAGPQPFSSAWLSNDDPPEPPRAPFRLPGWISNDRSVSAGLLVVVSLAVALVALRSGAGTQIDAGGAAVTIVSDSGAPTGTTLPAPTVAAAPTLAPAEPPAADAADLALAPAPEFAQASDLAADPAAQVARAPAEGPLLPKYRIVTYYGHPHDPAMGIVGEHAMEDLAGLLTAEAANYAAADPTRPVIPAFELIATVAQRVPGSDGTYILDTDTATLLSYIDYAAAHGMLVFLDVQIGRGTVASDIEKVRDLLARPNVHLVLDPEFAVAEGEIPGEYIGALDAESITYAQEVLAEIAATNGLPPKILIVHQFREDMIEGKERIAPYPGVQLVIDADGYGAPELKTAVYNFLVRDEPIEFAGVKIFYRQDVPVMSPQEILALVPSPDVIIYQ